LRKTGSVKKKRDDLFSQGEMFVLQQQTPFENSMNEIKLILRISGRALPIRCGKPQFSTEIKMTAYPSEQSMLRERIAKWAFAHAGGTEEEDSINRV